MVTKKNSKSFFFWIYASLIVLLGTIAVFYVYCNSSKANLSTIIQTKNFSKGEIREALIFNRSLLMENFIVPNRLRFPTSRNILEKYYN